MKTMTDFITPALRDKQEELTSARNRVKDSLRVLNDKNGPYAQQHYELISIYTQLILTINEHIERLEKGNL